MEGPGLKQVDNETHNASARPTKDGRTVTYRMKVLQQPSMARACGSGAKASADRRPVDPPPIVELRIYEGDSEHDQRDITQGFHANYFLFATLEHARVMANPRLPPDQKATPVLTGTPVAGMVNLERPKPAGYFIFPDLSVRHEGHYRLSFSLYEEIKETRDQDKDDMTAKPNEPESAHVTHRLEVKSQPFQVYSAKKFPGLSESTSLSRVVAEQGCRVRIRRDVRMRRRETKNTKDWDGYEDETAEQRHRMSATPDNNGYPILPAPAGYMDHIPRPRSASNASHHSLVPASRRPSLQEINYHHQHMGSAPHTPQQSTYLHTSPYASQQSGGHYFVNQPAGMQPPAPQFNQPTYPPPAPATGPSQQGSYGYPSSAQAPHMSQQPSLAPPPPPSAFESSSQSNRMSVDTSNRMSIDYSTQPSYEHRRSSGTYQPPPPAAPPMGYAPQPAQQYHHVPPPPPPASQHSQQSYQSQPLPQAYQPQPPSQAPYPGFHGHHSSSGSIGGYDSRPTPAEPIQPPTRATGATTPLSTSRSSFATNNAKQLPPLSSISAIPQPKYIEPASPASAGPHKSSFSSSSLPVPDTNKRHFSEVFSDRYQAQPLRQGARPNPELAHVHRAMPAPFAPSPWTSTPLSAAAVQVDEDEDPSQDWQKAPEYHRANGEIITRDVLPDLRRRARGTLPPPPPPSSDGGDERTHSSLSLSHR